MLDVASIATVIAFFIGCEAYIGYCDRLLNTSGRERSGRHD